MVFSFKKKEKVPEELPNLGINEIKREISRKDNLSSGSLNNMPENKINQDSLSSGVIVSNPHSPVNNLPLNPEQGKTDLPLNAPLNPSNTLPEILVSSHQKPSSEDTEASFFNGMLKDVNRELTNLKKLESWYNHEIMPKDVVSEMKEYWEKQRPNAVVRVVGRGFKENILEKINNLGRLESDWKEISIKLIEKEEEIRKEEKELKSTLSEFVKICKEKLHSKKK